VVSKATLGRSRCVLLLVAAWVFVTKLVVRLNSASNCCSYGLALGLSFALGSKFLLQDVTAYRKGVR
jgi:hypothetical protein